MMLQRLEMSHFCWKLLSPDSQVQLSWSARGKQNRPSPVFVTSMQVLALHSLHTPKLLP